MRSKVSIITMLILTTTVFSRGHRLRVTQLAQEDTPVPTKEATTSEEKSTTEVATPK